MLYPILSDLVSFKELNDAFNKQVLIPILVSHDDETQLKSFYSLLLVQF